MTTGWIWNLRGLKMQFSPDFAGRQSVQEPSNGLEKQRELHVETTRVGEEWLS